MLPVATTGRIEKVVGSCLAKGFVAARTGCDATKFRSVAQRAPPYAVSAGLTAVARLCPPGPLRYDDFQPCLPFRLGLRGSLLQIVGRRRPQALAVSAETE